eukprot:TRINITY_DN35693_c0_g1_i2.p1 TRINITY_DN35693_c0_g1~~TRINITY_DN35693_c0_g1_i2.p1  ORF type:complete len:152 (+),score=25.35 TRINITY_DN35693_c0_g1_i2:56-457(+)
MARLASGFLAACSFYNVAWALEADWTSYSADAELPMSNRWREDMLRRLAEVDTSQLTPKLAMQHKLLKRRIGKSLAGLKKDSNGAGGHGLSWSTIVCSFAALLSVFAVPLGIVWYFSLDGKPSKKDGKSKRSS